MWKFPNITLCVTLFIFTSKTRDSRYKILDTVSMKTITRPPAYKSKPLELWFYFLLEKPVFEVRFRDHLVNLAAGNNLSTLHHGAILLRQKVFPNVIYCFDRKYNLIKTSLPEDWGQSSLAAPCSLLIFLLLHGDRKVMLIIQVK